MRPGLGVLREMDAVCAQKGAAWRLGVEQTGCACHDSQPT